MPAIGSLPTLKTITDLDVDELDRWRGWSLCRSRTMTLKRWPPAGAGPVRQDHEAPFSELRHPGPPGRRIDRESKPDLGNKVNPIGMRLQVNSHLAIKPLVRQHLPGDIRAAFAGRPENAAFIKDLNASRQVFPRSSSNARDPQMPWSRFTRQAPRRHHRQERITQTSKVKRRNLANMTASELHLNIVEDSQARA